MAKSYQDFIDWLYGLQKFGIKLGLEKIEYLLDQLGNPHNKYPVIHIAGTNGKGSVASMIAAVLQNHGLKTGLYTSPHLVHFTERIKINGIQIKEDAVIEYSKRIQSYVDIIRATFFEATTAIAMKYFADQKIDVAVIETGLGGRFDATNVVTPILSVITSVGLEHQKYLGRTLSRIAYEKGGIIKKGAPVVTGVQSVRAMAVLQEIADLNGSDLIDVTPHAAAVVQEKSLQRTVLDLYFREEPHYEKMTIGLPGTYQIKNALIAVRAIDVLRGKIGNGIKYWDIKDEEVRRGLEQVASITGIKGRMQLIEKGTVRWLLDVAHNPGGVRELSRSLTDLGQKPGPVVFGVLNDKDVRAMLQTLIKIARILYLVLPQNERAVPVEKLREIAEELFFPVIVCGPVSEGIRSAELKSLPDDIIVVTGSHFVVGEALEILE